MKPPANGHIYSRFSYPLGCPWSELGLRTGTEVGLLKNNLPVLQNPLSFSDYDNVDHDILRKPDWRPEMSSKSHQQVQDGNDILGVDRLDTPLVHSTVGPLKSQSISFVKKILSNCDFMMLFCVQWVFVLPG